ncbi:hypothetical protein FWD07_02280 [Candidatus Saccharibacteria bacterium]|nr:hypothetical protein [Candidatus Saccharibacteria bacterium]
MRLGLDGKPPMTLEEIGVEFGTQRERPRQIIEKAMRKLRHPSRARRIKLLYATRRELRGLLEEHRVAAERLTADLKGAERIPEILRGMYDELKALVPGFSFDEEDVGKAGVVVMEMLRRLAKTVESFYVKDSALTDRNPARFVVIEDLDLTIRTYNCMKRARKDTLGAIADMTEDEMMRVRNLGRKSMEEVVSKLHEYGLDLKREE